MKQFPLLIKPASADCNLRCKYCFYIDHLLQHNNQQKRPRMSEDILEHLVISYMNLPFSEYIFNWQGGEPTLMGIDFFRKAVEFQKIYGNRGVKVGNGLQTNGVLLNDENARFFSEYNFLLGVSLDGPSDIHDAYRKNIGGQATHRKVMRGIDHLRQHNVEFNILCLVNNLVVKQPDKIYRYFRDKGFKYLQFIPCVEYDNQGELRPYAVTAEQWGRFLCRIFDLWMRKDTHRISIRLFDSVLNYLADGIYVSCDMGKNCSQYFVVEYNGDIFPCDFNVKNELKLGNIRTDTWQKISENVLYKDFGKQKSRWNNACSECDYLAFCHGDCQRMRGRDPNELSSLCRGWKEFYNHSLSGFKKLAEEIKQQRHSLRM